VTLNVTGSGGDGGWRLAARGWLWLGRSGREE
jgi:hypothetical protein